MRVRRLLTAATLMATVLTVLGLSSATARGSFGDPATGSGTPPLAFAPTYQPPSENLYVPITPCRIVDTRAGTGTGGTPFVPLQTRTYYVSGTFGFGPQGGTSGGCGIPTGAVALAATLLVVSPSKGGRIHAWPNGVSEPTATTFYYGGMTSSSGTTLSINPSSAYSLKIRNYSATTDLVIDVSGYYVKPITAFITPSGGLYAGSSRAVDASRTSEGVYRVTFDRDVHLCSVVATGYVSSVYTSVDGYSYSATREVVVRVFTAAGTPADQYVYVAVTC